MYFFCLFSLLFISKIAEINCDGRLLNPASRSSAWRSDFRFPYYPNDDQMNCGGFTTQWVKNGGRCGICGEDYSKIPKLFEKGGSYYRGYTVITYNQGSIINVGVQITVNLKGYFEFRICNVDVISTGEATQACLDRTILKDRAGNSRIVLGVGSTGLINIQLQLPTTLYCNKCVFQWKYHTGNLYGIDPVSRKGCLGCGNQPEFYGCADVKINRLYRGGK